jgi:excisionase family DNA binding protein
MIPDSTEDPRTAHGHRYGDTHADSHRHSHAGSTVTPAEYARLTGLHIRTVRERIRRGELPAVMVKGRHGPEYRIPHPDTLSAQSAPTVTVTVDLPSINGDSHGPDSVDPPFPDPGLGELVALVDRLSRENLELAGRCGWLQAQLEAATTRIRELEAPKPDHAAAGDQVADQAQSETGNRSASVANGQGSGAECPPPRPWWKFWQA